MCKPASLPRLAFVQVETYADPFAIWQLPKPYVVPFQALCVILLRLGLLGNGLGKVKASFG